MSKKVVVRARKKGTNKVVLSDIADVKEKSTSIIEDRGTEESELKGILQANLEEQCTAIKQEPEQVEEVEQTEDKKLNKKSKNNKLNAARKAKNDEFYTTLSMIENELAIHQEYKEQFRDMTILCNCDDPFWSDFYEFFKLVAVNWGIKRLIFTSYKENTTDDDKAFVLDWDRTKDKIVTTTKLKPRVHELKGNGDFASAECIEYLKQSDIVVTNPPFSKFRQFFDLLMAYEKDFVLVAPVNALTYKNVFPYIQQNILKIGYLFNKTAIFYTESMFDEEVSSKYNICFITTLNLDKPKDDIQLNCLYYGNEEKYPKFDNIDAINVNKVKDIPKDYYGIMGVPITFLGNYSPEQFQIIDGLNRYCLLDTLGVNKDIKAKKSFGTNINGKQTYLRILIQRRFYLSDDIEFNYYNIAIDNSLDYCSTLGVIETTMITVENECISLQDSLADYTIQIDCIFDNEPIYMYELIRKG